jgi:hypothetical protein
LPALLFRFLVALAAWTGLGVQYFGRLHFASQLGFVRNTVLFLGYFTVLSNLLIGLAALVPLLLPRSPAGRFLLRPSVRAALLLYIAITGIVNFVLLRGLWTPRGWALVGDTLLHYVVPLLFALDWLLLVPKGSLRWRDALLWLAFPLAYTVYALASGAITGFYPYPFLNVHRLGYGGTLANIGLMAIGIIAFALVLVALDRQIGTRRNRIEPGG